VTLYGVPCRPRPRAEAAGSEEIDLKERLWEAGSAACDMARYHEAVGEWRGRLSSLGVREEGDGVGEGKRLTCRTGSRW